jgi:hypothetical protein
MTTATVTQPRRRVRGLVGLISLHLLAALVGLIAFLIAYLHTSGTDILCGGGAPASVVVKVATWLIVLGWVTALWLGARRWSRSEPRFLVAPLGWLGASTVLFAFSLLFQPHGPAGTCNWF